MRSRNRVLSSILSCLTCLGSVGSASKGKPASPPAGEARRKNGNGGNKKGDRNAKEIVGIVPGTSTTTPRSGLSGRDIGFLAGGAAVGGFGGYFLGRKSSGNKSNKSNKSNGVKLSDVAMKRLAHTLCNVGKVSKDDAVPFIEAITNANVVLPDDKEIMQDKFDVKVIFNKDFVVSGVGDLTFNVEMKTEALQYNKRLDVTCSDNEGVCSHFSCGYFDELAARRKYLVFGLVAAVFRKCCPEVTKMASDLNDPVTNDGDFQQCAIILAQGFEIPEPKPEVVLSLQLIEEDKLD